MLKVEKNYKEYTAFFEENENGILTITVPALPGLVTEARNMKEAEKMLKEAIDCHVGGSNKTSVIKSRAGNINKKATWILTEADILESGRQAREDIKYGRTVDARELLKSYV